MFLLDSDTVIFALKGNPAVRANLKVHLEAPIKVSVVTCMELYYGAYKSQKVNSNLAKIRTLEESLEVIPLGPEISGVFGKLKAQLESSGARLDDFDLAIAACALAYDLTLVTNNTKHFRRVEGLKLANWTKYP
ncbi:MAG: tRNA(fMet)-specific endonuclease VapC [Deltaproteobacteria bacterium ADurb.BinA179]|jgi:predicted nucleic acid-binding protein|nr:MAG: tRNA(fMet)-specific endonuclease VapC [Deltaproteobacteria bacterium ADurb.BinA179]